MPYEPRPDSMFVCLFVTARQRRSGDLDQRGQFTAWAILFTLGPIMAAL